MVLMFNKEWMGRRLLNFPSCAFFSTYNGIFLRHILGEITDAIVYLLEPDRENYNLLKKNLGYFKSTKAF
jgi:hypothetical protein